MYCTILGSRLAWHILTAWYSAGTYVSKGCQKSNKLYWVRYDIFTDQSMISLMSGAILIRSLMFSVCILPYFVWWLIWTLLTTILSAASVFRGIPQTDIMSVWWRHLMFAFHFCCNAALGDRMWDKKFAKRLIASPYHDHAMTMLLLVVCCTHCPVTRSGQCPDHALGCCTLHTLPKN